MGSFTDAESLYNMSLTQDPSSDEDARLHYGLGVLAFNRQDYPQTMFHFLRCVELEPQFPSLGEIFPRLAQCYIAVKDYHKALEVLQFSLSLPNLSFSVPQIRIRMATLYDLLGNVASALKEYSDVITSLEGQTDPPESRALRRRAIYSRALLLINHPNNLQNVADQLPLLNMALEEDPANALAWYIKARYLMFGVKNYNEAWTALRHALKLNPSDPSLKAAVWCTLGVLYHSENRLPEAQKAYRHALQSLPHHTESIKNLGCIYELCGEPFNALLCFQTAAKYAQEREKAALEAKIQALYSSSASPMLRLPHGKPPNLLPLTEFPQIFANHEPDNSPNVLASYPAFEFLRQRELTFAAETSIPGIPSQSDMFGSSPTEPPRSQIALHNTPAHGHYVLNPNQLILEPNPTFEIMPTIPPLGIPLSASSEMPPPCLSTISSDFASQVSHELPLSIDSFGISSSHCYLPSPPSHPPLPHPALPLSVVTPISSFAGPTALNPSIISSHLFLPSTPSNSSQGLVGGGQSERSPSTLLSPLRPPPSVLFASIPKGVRVPLINVTEGLKVKPASSAERPPPRSDLGFLMPSASSRTENAPEVPQPADLFDSLPPPDQRHPPSLPRSPPSLDPPTLSSLDPPPETAILAPPPFPSYSRSSSPKKKRGFDFSPAKKRHFDDAGVDVIRVIEVKDREFALSESMQALCINDTSMIVLRGIDEAVGVDLDVFSSSFLARQCGAEEIEVRRQQWQPHQVNFDSHNKEAWRCYSASSRVPLSEYVSYQAQFQSLIEAHSAEFQAHGWTVPIEPNKTIATSIKFGTNLDLSDKAKWHSQLSELSKLPKFLGLQDEKEDMLQILKYPIFGMNTVQMYLKVPGCRTPGHQENNSFAAVNMNVGPGLCVWYIVQERYWTAMEALCAKENIDFLRGSWWPKLEDLELAGIPYTCFTQRPGDTIYLNPGTIHWVQSVGISNHVAWNVGQYSAKQLRLAWERSLFQHTIQMKSLVPMHFLAWSLSKVEYLTDVNFIRELRVILRHSLDEQKYILNALARNSIDVVEFPEQEVGIYCHGCFVEVFNILFTMRKNPKKSRENECLVFCLECVQKKRALSSCVVVQQIPLDGLEELLSNFSNTYSSLL